MNAFPYRAILSTDWNECLAPCGPFDFLAFVFPELEENLTSVFRQYTSNRLSLGKAIQQIQVLLPSPVTPDQMDAYLDRSFKTYKGVPALIEWCARNQVLFMINTTGMIGYFQRVFAKRLLPTVPVLSACPAIRFTAQASDPPAIFNLSEIPDKGRNTATAVQNHGIEPTSIILMGDSGGDGPHFKWGRKQGAFLIGSMTKTSLADYCAERNIAIDVSFGWTYGPGEAKNTAGEMGIDFMELVPVIEAVMRRSRSKRE
jgi:hypothetical protein